MIVSSILTFPLIMGKDARWPGAFIAGLVFRVVAQLVSGAILIRLRSVVRVHPTRPLNELMFISLGLSRTQSGGNV